jgi:hypothetical protein
MAQTFAVNQNNDLYLDENGNIAIVNDITAIEQACAQSVKTQQGEIIFDINRGIPNFDTVWSKGQQSIPQWEAAVRTIILSNEDVIAIQQFQVSVAGNILNYQALIQTDFGLGLVNNGL